MTGRHKYGMDRCCDESMLEVSRLWNSIHNRMTELCNVLTAPKGFFKIKAFEGAKRSWLFMAKTKLNTKMKAKPKKKVSVAKKKCNTKKMRKRITEYVSTNVMLELKDQLRAHNNPLNSDLGDFLRAFDGGKWQVKTVSAYLNGARRFSFTTFFAVCEHFDLDPEGIAMRAFANDQRDHSTVLEAISE